MPRKSRKNVGLIGLGIIGSRVATGLRASGYQVFVWNRSPKAAPNFVGSPAEVAELCDIVQLFVADAQALFDVLDQMSGVLTARHVIICSATVGPEATIEAARLVEEKGARFLDAPFTGSRAAAERRDLVYYIGGDDATFLRARPVLEASSRAIVRIGEIGHAATVKVVTNMIAAVQTQTLGEALAIVQKAGLDPEVLAAALEHNACRSGTMDMKLPKMVMGDYEPHFSLKHMFKDVQMGIHIANALDIEIPVTTVTAGVMYGALNRGWGELDFSALYKTYEPPTRADGNTGLPPAEKMPLPDLNLDPKELHYPETKVAAPARPPSEPAKADKPTNAATAAEAAKSGALPRLSQVLNAPGLVSHSDDERGPGPAKRVELPRIAVPTLEAASATDSKAPAAGPPKESLRNGPAVATVDLVVEAPERTSARDLIGSTGLTEARREGQPLESTAAFGATGKSVPPEKIVGDVAVGASASATSSSGAEGEAARHLKGAGKFETVEVDTVAVLIGGESKTLPTREDELLDSDHADQGGKPFNFVKRWFVSRPGG